MRRIGTAGGRGGPPAWAHPRTSEPTAASGPAVGGELPMARSSITGLPRRAKASRNAASHR